MNSPAWRKPNYPMHAAAHKITRSGCVGFTHQTVCRRLVIAGVMGNLGFGG